MPKSQWNVFIYLLGRLVVCWSADYLFIGVLVWLRVDFPLELCCWFLFCLLKEKQNKKTHHSTHIQNEKKQNKESLTAIQEKLFLSWGQNYTQAVFCPLSPAGLSSQECSCLLRCFLFFFFVFLVNVDLFNQPEKNEIRFKSMLIVRLFGYS